MGYQLKEQLYVFDLLGFAHLSLADSVFARLQSAYPGHYHTVSAGLHFCGSHHCSLFAFFVWHHTPSVPVFSPLQFLGLQKALASV
jgi:hypothetical protein